MTKRSVTFRELDYHFQCYFEGDKYIVRATAEYEGIIYGALRALPVWASNPEVVTAKCNVQDMIVEAINNRS